MTLTADDDQVTGEDKLWVRHDGGSDDAIELCNDDSSTGGSRRQANEPYSVVDPTDPETIVAGWNDYCLADLGMGWQGLGYSRDGGQTWFNSFVPGYPLDTSSEGQESPLFGRNAFAGDPIAAFDNQGNLFVGGISFNRAGAINGHVYVATYTSDDVALPGADDYPANYSHTRIVGRGTPSRNFQGIFQDKPLLEVDRTGGAHDGNVYVCWSRFTAFGQNKIYFSRSTDTGNTFSKPIALTQHGSVGSVQGCDIAVEADGDVYVTFRTFNDSASHTGNALAFVRSTDGGASFSRARKIRNIVPYAPADPSRDCGDGPFQCPADFVFHRVPLEPRVTADQNGELDGIFLTYNAVDPASIVPSDTSYSSAGAGRVGQSLIYVVSSTNNGRTWSPPVAVNPGAGVMQTGHHFFPDIDALNGQLAVVWQDNRNDPEKSVQFPIGNMHDADKRGVSTGAEVVDSFLATSTNGAAWTTVQVSDQGHQSQYEMFGARDIPFHGDYNWISLVWDDSADQLVGYMTWTDNRDVVEGTDPRETFDDGFDVHQCREEDPDGTFGPDTCPNDGGLDQNIYGRGVTFP
ncbi:MAG: glycoside hydrolase [Chloroflexota bacterium]|nr:glycoside hydrolase [Chloroflexota bacterium]